MVVSARVEASQIGLDIMSQGGNAFDAMIATHLALAVAYPYAGNIGGGGFMVYREANGSSGTLDFREKAPGAAHRDMYLNEQGDVISGASTRGALAVGVPGSIAGIFAVHERFGSLPINVLFEPAIRLARQGIVVTEKQAEKLAEYQGDFAATNQEPIPLMKSFSVGDTITHRDLAHTLERIVQGGNDAFYTGQMAQEIVDLLQQHGGIITVEDLANYQAQWRDPVSFQYDDLSIISMPPPSSGGLCLAQIMRSIESFDLHELSYQGDSMIQILVEAERLSYADRSKYLGDPDFVDVPVQELLDSTYICARMSNFSFDTAGSSTAVQPGSLILHESDETTHYSIIDQFGNAVSVTTTINSGYGSKLYHPTLGFFFNNEMDDFSAKPGEPNLYGLVGTEANAIAPNKRMLSSMTPTIIEKDGELWMVLGTPGGSRIITSVLQTILNVHEFDMTMQEAVNAPRFHHQWLPDEIMMEQDKFPVEVMENLQSKGYDINQERAPVQGKVDAILVLPDGVLQGGADPRGDDAAVSSSF